jgi:antitoxin component YwqK of YwqJK toxin-antitoxin module
MRHTLIFISTLLCLTSCYHTVVTERHSNGKPKEERTYFNSDSTDFKIVQYYPSGRISFEGNVINKLFVGQKINYYENATIKQIDSLYKPCALDFCCCDGLVKRYRENGILQETFINKNGVENGLVFTYDTLGRLETKYEMVNGRKNGKAEKYFENGILAFKATFQNDTIQGYALYFYGNGDTLKMMKYYGDGMDFPYYKWLKNGQIIKGEVINNGKQILWSWMDKNRNILKTKTAKFANEITVPDNE